MTSAVVIMLNVKTAVFIHILQFDSYQTSRSDTPKHCSSKTSVRYRGADKSLARPTSRCILFDGENISFDDSLVMYINSTNIPPIMIINRIYETQSSVTIACFLPGRAKDLSAPLQSFCTESVDSKSQRNPQNQYFKN